MGVEILVVQHGEKVRSAGDPGLSDEGHRQAAVVAMWLAENRPEVGAIVASPLRRAQETADPIAAAFGLELTTDARLAERMNWDDGANNGLDEFMSEWQRATDDRSYQPAAGDSSLDAADRFIAALVDLERGEAGVVVVVAHGGVTVDALRTIAGDDAVGEANADLISDGVPCCAITRLLISTGAISVIDFPSTEHLGQLTRHRPA
jgi:broad specificity phosphatase PhoE